jgi:mevalonate kinase
MEMRIPGKLILVGEYAALWGAPTLVVAVQPSFRVTVDGVVDQGLGPGFGSSTGYFCRKHIRALPLGLEQILELREILRSEADPKQVRPSGVDLICQLRGGSVLVEGNRVEDLPIEPSVLDSIWVARPRRLQKVDTQGALKSSRVHSLVQGEENQAIRNQWSLLTATMIQAFVVGDWSRAVPIQNQIEKMAYSFGAISTEAFELVTQARSTFGVKFVKGCGALFQDVFILSANEAAREELNAQFHFLGVLSDLFSKEGICEE